MRYKFIGIFFLFSVALSAHAAFTTAKPKVTSLDTDSTLKGRWTFDGINTGIGYAQDSTSNKNIATTTLVTRAIGKIGQALGFNLATPPTWNNGLVGWWNMDTNRTVSNISDLSGNGNTGSLFAATSTVTGKIGQALSFNGSTSYIDVPSSASLNIGNNPMTMSAWVYWISSTDTYNTIIERYADGGVNGYTFLLRSDQKIAAYFDPNSGSCNMDGLGGTVSFNTWHLITAVSTGSNIITYIDGVEDYNKVAACSMSQSTTVLRIGHARVVANRYFNGYMDDVRVYNRALSASEVAEMYRGSSYAQISPAAISTGLDTFTNTGLTVGAWVKYASSTGNQILMRKADTATSSNAYQLSSNGTNFQFLLGTTTSLTITGTTAIKPNIWYYVAGVADGTNMRLYVNGKQEASATQSGTTINTISPTTNNWGNSLFFGMDDSPANFLTGNLDDPRVYARAFSANEIMQTYTQGTRAVTVAKPKVTPTNLASNLVGHWTFDGKDCGTTYCLDKSGNNFSGTLTGTSKMAGKLGQAINFKTSTDLVSVAHNTTLSPTTALTLAGWVRPAIASQSNVGIIGKIFNQGGDSNCSYALSMSGNSAGKAQMSICVEASPASFINLDSTSILAPGKWYFVVGTYDKANIKIYINGKLEATLAETGNINISTNNLHIGSYGNPGNFLGSIDDVRVYSRALSAGEVQQLYTQGTRAVTVAKPKVTPTNLASNLVGHWTFDGKDTGLTYTIDKSGTGATGTLSGGVVTRPGTIGQALNFDGSDDFVSISASAQTTIGNLTNNFSVSAWVYPATVSGIQRVIAHSREATSNGWAFGTNGTGIRFTTFNVSDYDSTTLALSSGKWQHIAAVMDSNNAVTFYLNGKSYNTVAGALPALVNTDDALQLSATTVQGASTLSEVFGGRTDDIRVYSRALSANEIYRLYRLGM